ncbi:YceI family protein [Desertivirga xinjiangensis]|uniref:YceI family protein n=1 Tax=Desertivirga xinjiangensis TaxID=539206 RepID=UPI00210A1450|nr:YceI family protein [Pedobacter xinjiangensis]
MATTTTWVIDPTHSEIQFKVKHLVISTVTGNFRSFDGKAVSANEDFTDSEIEFTIDVNSIDTNQEQRDAHLKSADFFDAEKYPKMSFKSTSFKKEGSDYKLVGDLTIKDVTKQVELDVEFGGVAGDFYGNTKAGFELSGKISRREFGLVWSGITEAGTVVVGDDIKLVLSVQFAKQA